MNPRIASRRLGGLTPRDFLRRHWQKRPLFVRGALAGLGSLVDAGEIPGLAARDDVESRVVVRRGRSWTTTHGPFLKLSLKKRDWTVLVSGVNLHHAGADRLLRSFDFIPQARLDDLMVSYAAPGGGVGPHVDSYDVFLLQGAGRRRWTVWFAGRKTEYIAGTGDLLYLPPGLKHDGVALEPCFTYSVGFRAPRGAELAAAFLDFLHERGLPDALYADPELRPARQAAAIPGEMLAFTTRFLRKIRWNAGDVARFLGEYLTLPKAHVVFRARPARGTRLRLDAKSQLLYAGPQFFLNGETVAVPARARAAMRELANAREIDARRLAALGGLVGQWRGAGYAHLEKK